MWIWIIGIIVLIVLIMIILMIMFSKVYITVYFNVDKDQAYVHVKATLHFITIFKKTFDWKDLSFPKQEKTKDKKNKELDKNLLKQFQLEWVEADVVIGTEDVVFNALSYPVLVTLKEWLRKEKGWELNVATDFTGNELYIKGGCMISMKLVKTISAWKLRKEYG